MGGGEVTLYVYLLCLRPCRWEGGGTATLYGLLVVSTPLWVGGGEGRAVVLPRRTPYCLKYKMVDLLEYYNNLGELNRRRGNRVSVHFAVTFLDC